MFCGWSTGFLHCKNTTLEWKYNFGPPSPPWKKKEVNYNISKQLKQEIVDEHNQVDKVKVEAYNV